VLGLGEVRGAAHRPVLGDRLRMRIAGLITSPVELSGPRIRLAPGSGAGTGPDVNPPRSTPSAITSAKLPVEEGRAWTSTLTATASATRASEIRRDVRATISVLESVHSTVNPRRASSTAVWPGPQPTSSTRAPGGRLRASIQLNTSAFVVDR
jgi:hypothetical protein